MATFNELRAKLVASGSKLKTTKKRDDGVSLRIDGIAAEATPQSRAELAAAVGCVIGLKHEDGTNETGSYTGGELASATVLGVYNAEADGNGTKKKPTK